MGLFDDDFDSTPLTGQRGANLFDFPGVHKIKLRSFKKLGRKPGIGVDAEVVASTNGGLQPGASAGWPLVKGQFPEYFNSACKRVVGYALGKDPEQVKKSHVEACVTDQKHLRDKVIVVETTAPNSEGYSNINVIGDASIEVKQGAPGTGTQVQRDSDDDSDDSEGFDL